MKNKLKKISIIVLALMCLFTSRILANSKEYKVTKKISELGTKFDYKKGYCLVDYLYVEYNPLNRGAEVQIVDEDDDYYYCLYEGNTLAIDKSFVRSENEKPFVGFTAFTREGAKVYADYNLSESLGSFKLNDNIDVIDKVNNIYLVTYNGKTAYMLVSSLSETKIVVYVAPKIETPVDTGGGGSSHDDDDGPSGDSGGGGGGGGDSGGGDSGGGETQGDGDDMELAFYDYGYRIVPLVNTDIKKGTVLVDNTTSYIAILRRNDEVKVVKQDGDNYVLTFNGYKAEVEKKYIRMASESEPDTYTLYARSGAGVYQDYTLNTTIKTLSINDIVTVVDEIDDYYVIVLDDGSFGYILKSNTSIEKLQIYVAPKIETPVDTGGGGSSHDDDDGPSGDSGGGGGGGGDSGGGDSGGGDDAGESDWTPEAM